MEREQKFHPDKPLNCPALPALPSVCDLKEKPSQSADNSKPPQAPAAPAPSHSTPTPRAEAAREKGRSLEQAFKNLGGESFHRAADMGNAVRRGQVQAAMREDFEAHAAQDTDILRSFGFTGPSDDDF